MDFVKTKKFFNTLFPVLHAVAKLHDRISLGKGISGVEEPGAYIVKESKVLLREKPGWVKASRTRLNASLFSNHFVLRISALVRLSPELSVYASLCPSR